VIAAGCAAFWRALTGRPAPAAVSEAPAAGPAWQGEPSV
jgi:hypothetical protein